MVGDADGDDDVDLDDIPNFAATVGGTLLPDDLS